MLSNSKRIASFTGIQEEVTFDWNFRSYKYHNFEPARYEEFGTYHALWVGYPRLDVKITSQSYRVDLNSFVSAVGGGLGLFLGFSIIDTLFYLYEKLFSFKTSFKNRIK